MSSRVVQGAYARLTALRSAVQSGDGGVHKSIGDDYRSILAQLKASLDDPFDGFELGNDCYWSREDGAEYYYSVAVLKSKIRQLADYLEAVHLPNPRMLEIGSVFNLIQDTELKSRCSDLLSARGHFDRVVNQATLVLEERIRAKLPDLKSDFGMVLVGKAFNPEPSKSRIRFSDVSNEHEGYTSLFRGVIGAFRNPSHHRFMEEMTREQALQVCAFIDNMLFALENATVHAR